MGVTAAIDTGLGRNVARLLIGNRAADHRTSDESGSGEPEVAVAAVTWAMVAVAPMSTPIDVPSSTFESVSALMSISPPFALYLDNGVAPIPGWSPSWHGNRRCSEGDCQGHGGRA